MFNRFRFVAALFSLCLPLYGHAETAAAQPLLLWYRQPAGKWVEALPLGNGRLGAMVFGGVPEEHLQLNEDTLYAGGPYPDFRNWRVISTIFDRFGCGLTRERR
jgi:hypothetical protein